MYDIFYDCLHFYLTAAMRFWDNLGPRQYATILIVVGVTGWLAMRSNLRKVGS